MSAATRGCSQGGPANRVGQFEVHTSRSDRRMKSARSEVLSTMVARAATEAEVMETAVVVAMAMVPAAEARVIVVDVEASVVVATATARAAEAEVMTVEMRVKVTMAAAMAASA